MADARKGIGGRIAPARFLAFILIAIVAAPAGIALIGWRMGMMAGFDLAAAIFLVSCAPLMRYEADDMRQAAKANDANRVALLGITGIVMIVVLVAIAAELSQHGAPGLPTVMLVVGTLMLSWLFSNMIYTLHYAHIFYGSDAGGGGKDRGGLDFPGTPEPDYWDFVYFAFCLGMTFQTSDVDMTSGPMRRTATAHCLAAFVFNLGVVAFTINVLGGG